MSFTFSLFLFLSFFQTSFEIKIADQAAVYIKSIENGEHLSENYWALNEIYESSCSLNNAVIRLIINSSSRELKSTFSSVSCGTHDSMKASNKLTRMKDVSLSLGLLPLAINYLLSNPDLDAQSRFQNDFLSKWSDTLDLKEKDLVDFIVNKKQMDLDYIPENGKELIFYSVLYNYQINTYFQPSSLEKLSKDWKSLNQDGIPESNLISSIQGANTVFLFYELYQYSEFHELLPYIMSIQHFPHSKERTRYLSASSFSLFSIGRYDESLKILREHLIPLSSFLELKDVTDRSIFTKGVNLYSLGKFKEAKAIFEDIYYDPNSSIEKYQLFNNLSICYLKLGEKNKYLNYQLDALNEIDGESNYKEQLIILRNLFIYYTNIKDSKTALLYLDQAEKIAIKNDDTYELALIHAFSGTFYWNIYKDSEKALAELRYARSEFDEATNYINIADVIKEEAEILVAIDSLESAKQIFNELKELSKVYSNSANYVEALIGLTEVALLNKDLSVASKILQEIKIYPLEDLDFELSVKYNTVKSSFLASEGNVREAYEQLLPTVQQVIDRSRTGIDAQTGFWNIEAEYIGAFTSIVSMLIEIGNTSKAVQFLDELKTINDAALYNSPILRAERLSEEDLAQDQLLNTKILELRTDYLNSSSSKEQLEIKQEIDSFSAQREEISNKIRTGVNSKPTSIWAFQKKLKIDEMAIHLTELGDQLFISYISRDDIKIEVLPFNASVKQYFNQTADLLASSKTNLERLYEVYNMLNIKANIPSGITLLTVIPDNYLYRLPLGILPTQKPKSSISFGSAHYLIEDYNIRYFTSLNDFVDNSRRYKSDSDTDFSAFAVSDFRGFENTNLPSLPYATEEARNVYAKLDNFKNKSIFLEDDATKSSFIYGASNSRIIHVATHSEVSEQDPLFSTIYLNNNTNDELTSLYAYELFETQMNNELIMLNSCSSGSGSFLQGSGIMGISRALRYAGAESLGLNLWSVNDKTASEFATTFYEGINQGKSKWEAMRKAKLELLRTGNANPYYWGSYMLIGNSSPLTEKPAKAGFLYSLLAIVIITASFYLRDEAI